MLFIFIENVILIPKLIKMSIVNNCIYSNVMCKWNVWRYVNIGTGVGIIISISVSDIFLVL